LLEAEKAAKREEEEKRAAIQAVAALKEREREAIHLDSDSG
jgi:DNA-directed RNA polymerase specialized sigma subunit